jgi:hypothetical protein
MAKLKVVVDVTDVDWEWLRKQKEKLAFAIIVGRETGLPAVDDLEELLHLLDSIQDQAADILGEETVFG